MSKHIQAFLNTEIFKYVLVCIQTQFSITENLYILNINVKLNIKVDFWRLVSVWIWIVTFSP